MTIPLTDSLIVNGALLMYGSKQSANDPNTSFFPSDLATYLSYFQDKFNPNMTVSLNSCGSANPLNNDNPAQIFQNIFPTATVSGWTGLTFMGNWGLSSSSIIDSDYAKNPFVPQSSEYITFDPTGPEPTTPAFDPNSQPW